MKFLVLVCALLTVFAYAQEDVVNSADPNMSLYNSAYTAASMVDNTGTHEKIQTDFHNIAVDKSCPACNLHGSINLVDEGHLSAGSSAVVKASNTKTTEEDDGAQGP